MERVTHFLKTIRPEGPWLIWVKFPDGPCFTRTFHPGQEEALNKLIDSNINSNNLYFLLNHQTGDFNDTKNPEKNQMKFMDFVHVDIDPDHRKDFNEERAAILGNLTSYKPAPSFIIDSGGGYQAYWRLEPHAQVINDSSHSNVTELEAHNRYLERYFNADHCHNLNRLMRLPYTKNFPDARKRSRGRVTTDTALVEMNTNRYPLSNFIQAEIVSENITVGNADIIDFGNLQSVDVDLLKDISDKVKEIIKDGHSAYGKDSRSEAVFYVVVELLRAKYSDDVIAALLLDRTYKISEHIYNTSRDPESCVKRTLHNAKVRMQNKSIAEMNERYCIVLDGGKVFVLEESYNPELGRMEVERYRPTEFHTFHSHRMYQMPSADGQTPGKKVSLTKYWMTHVDKRYFGRVVFMPNKMVPGAYNLWRGFAFEPSPKGSWEKFKQHIFSVLCQGEVKNFEYLMNWMARTVQQPGSPGEVSVVFRGKKGSGKTFFASFFGKLFGAHYKELTQQKHVTGNFNSQLRSCVLLLAEEAFFAGDKQSESALKPLITGKILNVEYKGVDLKETKNSLHLIMASNEDWVVPASDDERRFFVLDVSPALIGNQVHFDAIEEELLNGGYEAMLYELQTRDISSFNVRDVPKTKALSDQKLLSLGAEYKWWMEKLNDGQITPTHMEWEEPVESKSVIDDYNNICRRIGTRYQKASLDAFFKKVLPTECPPDRVVQKKYIDSHITGTASIEKVLYYKFPRLKDCRSKFSEAINTDIAWSTADDVPVIKEAERILSSAF